MGSAIESGRCPLVTRVHHAAQRLQDRGYFVLVIGRRGHVEVQGIVEDLSRFEIIETPEEVREYEADRLGLVCQTTTPAHLAERIHAAVVATNPLAEVCFIDTVCHPTKEHQRALERLIEKADAVVVVGGRNSNNTLALAELCRSRGKAVLHVSSATEIEAGWFRGFDTVGLTAGTSTLDTTIEEVHEALLCLPTEVGVA
jgi:4-hydroxy-3-methylbut-2-enyl diphosphate reductase